MSSFLQSSAWQKFQKALGRTTLTDSGKDWSYLAIKEPGTLNNRLYTPYGPVCTSPETFDTAVASLKKAAQLQQTTFIRVEPLAGISPDQLRSRGFYHVKYQQLQPSHTQIIDLTQPKDDILAQMSQNSRNITRNYHKKGLVIRKSHQPDDISILTSLLSQIAVRNRITTHSDHYFQTQANSLLPIKAATLYIAELDGTPIAAALVYDSSDTRIYAHAAADDTYRKLSAGTALVGQMILDAKDDGLSYFDLYGTTESNDPNHPWAGFTKFKKSFGGHPTTYLGAWDLPLKPLAYWTYRTYQTIRRRLR